MVIKKIYCFSLSSIKYSLPIESPFIYYPLILTHRIFICYALNLLKLFVSGFVAEGENNLEQFVPGKVEAKELRYWVSLFRLWGYVGSSPNQVKTWKAAEEVEWKNPWVREISALYILAFTQVRDVISVTQLAWKCSRRKTKEKCLHHH